MGSVHDDGADPPKSLSPLVLGYVVAPLALVVLLILRHFGLIAQLPLWAYVVAIGAPAVMSVIVEPWHAAPPGSLKRQVRLAVHVLAVTAVIYMTGWGPALSMAYAFVALQELELWGSNLWQPVLWWTLLNIAVAQYLIWFGLLPSFLTRGQAEAVGILGALVVALVVRMAGATGEKKERAEALLAYQALHDMLTGLPNRALFYERTEETLTRRAADGSICAVMLFDLDRFKEINDTMGHRSGDAVLVEVGPRVKEVLRGGDTVARLGGDEFCVLLPNVSGSANAVQVAERIIAVLEQPFEMDGANLGIEASCGIALAPADGETADLLLQRADVAMYVAKGSQSSVVVYSDDLNVNTPARLALLADLRNAVAGNEFVLHYQPKAAMAHPAGGRGRGPDPLAASDPRPALSGHLHTGGGTDGPHRADDRLGPGGSPPSVPAVARRRRTDGSRRVVGGGEPVHPQPSRRRPSGDGRIAPWPGGMCRRTCSTSRSPRRSSCPIRIGPDGCWPSWPPWA